MADDDASSAEMRRLPAKRDADPLALDDETVERLLRGELSPAEAPPGYAEVVELLAAAAAPPSPGEVASQAAALAELRALTRPQRVASARRAARPRRRRTGLAIVVVAGALVTGGVAGATTGHLPGPVRDAARTILNPLGDGTPAPPTRPDSPPDPATTGGPASAGATTGPKGPQSTGTNDRGPASTAAGVDNEGLCQAYLAGKGAEQGKRLEAPALRALARAAGGEDKIADYCADLLPGQVTPKDDKDDRAQPDDQGQGQGQGGSSPSSGPGQGEGTPAAGSPRR
jgi:hypothetical protein